MLTFVRFMDCALAVLIASLVYLGLKKLGVEHVGVNILLNLLVVGAWREIWLREATLVWEGNFPSAKYGAYIKTKKGSSS